MLNLARAIDALLWMRNDHSNTIFVWILYQIIIYSIALQNNFFTDGLILPFRFL